MSGQKLGQKVNHRKNDVNCLVDAVLIQSSCQNVCHRVYMTRFETGLYCVENYVTRSDLGKKTCIHSRGHSFDPNFMKLCQKVYLHPIQGTIKTGLGRVKS